MPETSFHTTYSNNRYLFARAVNGSQSGLQRRRCYRFGFNGKEKVDELFESSGSAYDFGARLYDSRLGRWMACDPLAAKYPGYSPYHFGYCDPIIVMDPNGMENIIVIGYQGPPDKWMKRRYNFYRKAVHYANKMATEGEVLTVFIYGSPNEEEVVGASEYIKSLTDAGANIIYYNSNQEIIDYLNRSRGDQPNYKTIFEKITDLMFLCHGNLVKFLLKEGKFGMGYSDFEKVNKNAFTSDAKIHSGACHTAQEDLLRGLANLFGIDVIGPIGSGIYAGETDTGVYLEDGRTFHPNGTSTPSSTFEMSPNKQYKFRWEPEKIKPAQPAKDRDYGNKGEKKPKKDQHVPSF
ncbi:MAG: hypothetical protein A2W93_09670 [Bacteroidetes bacterium GWF2_43_63]|nr:MAG: hypothetical protein A2W94_07155 [Bacteroidetes bacterium GWE2_42_42]OFY54575.1 MAG: hypothetical protein A2W93_09670 [Bacteroidetes bacterium GWF2_43_63]HBG70615.1 hypothetical protein [Bacteroidales bacterium]HCB60912.1 hypothetical protein [Bacteroidales bacterium]